MPTQPATIEYLEDQISASCQIRTRKMFGEYALYCDEKVVALVCDDQLFIKITVMSPHFLDEKPSTQPYPGAKNFLLIPEEKWEEREWLSQFIQSTADNLPLPKLKKPKQPR